MSDRVRWGVLGNANIARVCVIPAIQKSRNGRVHALATRSPERSREVMETFEIPRVYQGYAPLLDEGRIGEPRLLHSSFCFHMQDEVLEAGLEPRLRPEMGGGALLDVGCYGVSVSRWLAGRQPCTVQSRAVYHPGGADIFLVGTLHFPNDVLATVEAGFITALRQSYAIVGTRGAIETPQDAFIPWERDTVFSLRGMEDEQGSAHVTPGEDEYQLMVEHFSDIVRGGAQLACPPAENVANMRVLDALAESARAGRRVSLE